MYKFLMQSSGASPDRYIYNMKIPSFILSMVVEIGPRLS